MAHAPKHYTPWGDLIEGFYDITVINPDTNEFVTLNTYGTDDEECPRGSALWEDGLYGMEQLRVDRNLSARLNQGPVFSTISGNIENNKYYCLNRTGRSRAENTCNNDYVQYDDYFCDRDKFGYKGTCIGARVPNYGSKLAQCFTAPLKDRAKECIGIDMSTAYDTYKLLPKPQVMGYETAKASPVVLNKTGALFGDADYYCPNSSPLLINDNLYGDARCATPYTFGLVFNRYCDTNPQTNCLLRTRPPPHPPQRPEEPKGGEPPPLPKENTVIIENRHSVAENAAFKKLNTLLVNQEETHKRWDQLLDNLNNRKWY